MQSEFEPSISVSRNRHLNHMTNVLHKEENDIKTWIIRLKSTLCWPKRNTDGFYKKASNSRVFEHAVATKFIDKNNIRNELGQSHMVRRKIILLKTLVKHLKNGPLKLLVLTFPFYCDFSRMVFQERGHEMCGETMDRKKRGDRWWCNEEVNEEIKERKIVHKAMYRRE